jgi:bifunctional DNA-binding transcriptional regulator/antitoxin component of YhaV-PrlF toxin-antitoxin module
MTGKNQVTVPAEIAAKAGMKSGTRLDWRMTDREGILEVHILPSQAALASGLMGRGNSFKRAAGSPVSRLLAEREQEENLRTDE